MTTAVEQISTARRRQHLLAQLADGSFHSGERLAQGMHISRSAVWKLITGLRKAGVEIQAVPRQGYRLPRPVDLYDAELIRPKLTPAAREAVNRIDVLLTVDSTNHFVASLDAPVPGQMHVCMAEVQSAGRGRRGRSWLAPFGSGICVSFAWAFEELPSTISALSLAVGVAITRVLRRMGAEDVGLKWPNDLVWHGRKLAGILIEMRGESVGPAQVVIGLGLNMRMPAETRLALAEQQAALVADLHEMLRERTPTRNELVAALTDELFVTLTEFARNGFGRFAQAWSELDALANAAVKVVSGTGTVLGVARGVAADGSLLVDVDGELRRFVSGEVSLRAARA